MVRIVVFTEGQTEEQFIKLHSWMEKLRALADVAKNGAA